MKDNHELGQLQTVPYNPLFGVLPPTGIKDRGSDIILSS